MVVEIGDCDEFRFIKFFLIQILVHIISKFVEEYNQYFAAFAELDFKVHACIVSAQFLALYNFHFDF